MALLNLMFKMKAFIIFILLCISSYAFSMTSAGTKILNQAEMQYFNTERGETVTVLSNYASVNIGVLYNYALTPEDDNTILPESIRYASAGSRVTFPETLENTGNIKDKYILSVSNISGDSGDLYTTDNRIKIFYDPNGDGLNNFGERALELETDSDGNYITPELKPGEFLQLTFVVSVPSTAIDNDNYLFVFNSQSVGAPELTRKNEMEVILREGPAVNLSILSDPVCQSPVTTGDEIKYHVNYDSVGTSRPEAATEPYSFYISDGGTELIEVSHSGILITVDLPANVTIQPDKRINGEPAQDYSPRSIIPASVSMFDGGIVLVGLYNDVISGGDSRLLKWIDYSIWDGKGIVEQMGFLVKPSYMGPNTSGHFSYYSIINDISASEPFKIYSQASVELFADNSLKVESNEQCNTLDAIVLQGDNKDIFFETITKTPVDYDNGEDFTPTGFYYLQNAPNFDNKEDAVYVSFQYSPANQTNGIDIIGSKDSAFPVTLSSGFGDNVNWVFVETSPESGIFRSVTPIWAVTPEGDTPRTRNDDQQCDQFDLTGNNQEIQDKVNDYINLTANGLNNEPFENCRIEAQPNDMLTVSVFNRNTASLPVLSTTAIVSPQFTVFDATHFLTDADGFNISGLPGNIIEFYQLNNGVETLVSTHTSDANGKVLFPKLPQGENYFIKVTPTDNYIWATKYTDPTVFNTHYVGAPSYGINGYSGIENSGLFSIDGTNGLPIYSGLSRTSLDPNGITNAIFDIPLDPANIEQALTLQKDADKETAEIGEFVKYTLTLRNNLPESTVYNTRVIDELPYGFKYIAGSARLNDAPLADPEKMGTSTIQFNIGDVKGSTVAPENGLYVITYVLQLTAGAVDSDGINSASAIAHSLATSSTITANDNGFPIISNVAKYQLGISQTGVMSERGIIFGKVYVDAQCSDAVKNSVWPIGGVKIYLETGDYVITDENGQYSMFGIKPGNHVLKVDKQTLPAGIELAPIDTRNAGIGDSRFVDLRRGEYHKADFSAPCPTDDQQAIYAELQGRNNNINGDWLFDTAERFQGLTNKTSLPKADELTSGIVSGPRSNNKENRQTDKLSTSMLYKYSGYALEYKQGKLDNIREFYKLLPTDIKDEAYIYPLEEGNAALKIGFSHNQDSLVILKQKLADKKISTSITPTVYNNIPYKSRLTIDNQLADIIPLPEKEAMNITAAEANKGTWYWPKNDYSYHGRFIVVVNASVLPQLFVNGEKIGNDRVGERIINKEKKAQIVGWYGVDLEPGDNLVEVKAEDGFGNERTLLTKIFSHPKSADRINLATSGEVLKADGGRSVLPIKLKLFDENGKLARGTYFATLSSDKGNIWLDPDIQKEETGHQVRIINGEKTVYLRSSDITGQINVKAELDNFSDTLKVYQVAAQRPLFVSGLIEYTGRYGRMSGEAPSRQAEGYEDKSYTDKERAALFIKGNVKGGAHLTLSYDSDKSDEEYLREIAPDSYYPTPGDASIRGYDARSTSKWFAKLERERHFIMWGDYITSEGADRADLGITSQTLNGFNGMYNDGKFTAQLYAARPEDLHKVIEFNGNGTAMFYNIGDKRIVRHTETISLVTYDRNNLGLVLKEQNLTRYIDYTIDYFTGDVQFSRVVPSFDDELNPIKVRVAYDVDDNGEAYTIAGGRLSYLFTPYLAAGISYEYNDHELEGYDLGSVWVNYTIDSQTQLTASVATMSHEGSESANTVTTSSIAGNKLKNGTAVKLRLKRDWSDSTQTEIEYAYAQEGFTNTTGGVTPARQEIRLRHRQKLIGLTNLNIEANHSESLITDEKQQSVGATIDTKLFGSAWSTRLGSRYIKNETSDGNTEQYTTAIIGLGRSFNLFNRAGRIDSEYEQSFKNNEQRRFNIKADWNIHKQANLYAQYEYIDSISGISNLGSGTTSLLTAGIDVDWLHGGSTFSEFRQRGASDGRILEVANGYRGKFEIIPGISIDPSAEYIEVIKGEGTSGVAVSLGVADVRNPNYKTTGRIEYRHGDDQDYYGILGAWVTRLSQDWSALVREEYRYIDNAASINNWNNHLSVGVAYRPRLTNQYNMLGAYEWKVDRNDIKRTAHILSTHQNYQPSEDWLLSGRLGLKWEDYTDYDQHYNSVSTIIDGRVIYYINRRWDVDFHAGVLGTDGLSSRRYSYGLGLNYLVMKNLRAGIGYNAIGFDDSDLDPQGYNLQGFYFNMMFKLDEGLFGWLSE
ncbi:Cna protein B-type domain protein [Photobacterium andalusiense]|uniref:Cna protein B-type domain protein n=2 Tax=Photobacterium andalusiense TaxID=2204296 RepID=A0A1Y6MP17_9GAMM|nr:Cna protein B-type domain protein [Photobacterium andalusiense]